MEKSNVISKLRAEISTALSDVETSTGLQVQFQPLHGGTVVAQYRFDPGTNTATVLLRSDWKDVDVAHELMHMRLELVEGYAVLAWRSGVSQDSNVESAFARIRNYVDDEVVHARLYAQGLSLDGEVLKPQLFDDIYTRVPRYLNKLRRRPEDGMAHLDSIGYGELCRSSFLVRAELMLKNYSDALPYVRIKKVKRFTDAFRTHRGTEAAKADQVLQLFESQDVNSQSGHRVILDEWAKLEGLDAFVGPSVYQKQQGRYILPWP